MLFTYITQILRKKSFQITVQIIVNPINREEHKFFIRRDIIRSREMQSRYIAGVKETMAGRETDRSKDERNELRRNARISRLNAYCRRVPRGCAEGKISPGNPAIIFPGGYGRHLDFESNDRISSYSLTTTVTCPSSSHY